VSAHSDTRRRGCLILGLALVVSALRLRCSRNNGSSSRSNGSHSSHRVSDRTPTFGCSRVTLYVIMNTAYSEQSRKDGLDGFDTAAYHHTLV
jgi:hypothetical protein